MRQLILLLFYIFLSKTIVAQNFEGAYIGVLFTERNAITIRTTGNLVAGTVFINKQEKFIFFAEINGSVLTGTMNYASDVWTFKGNLIGDSLSLSLTSGMGMKQALLMKISSNPNKSISKLLDPAVRDTSARDQRLVGEWILKKIENPDGSPKAIDEKIKGAVYFISSSGSLYVEIPYLIRNSDFSPPKSEWRTKGSKLTITNHLKSSTVEYEIKSDTLILKPNIERTYWVKRK
jgi:hypothetical protein